jgi:hypothetical protein
MHFKTIPFLFGLIITLLLSSCNSLKPLEFRACKDWELKPGFTESTLQANLIYFNPNRTGVTLDQVEMEVFLDGRMLGKVSQHLQLPISGKQEFSLPMQVKLDMKNLLNNALSGLLKQKLSLRSVGKVRVIKAGIHLWIPVDATAEIENPTFR